MNFRMWRSARLRIDSSRLWVVGRRKSDASGPTSGPVDARVSRSIARMTLTALALTEAVKARALDLGFERVAIGPAEAATAHARQFAEWLEAGYGAGMDWIGESRGARRAPGRLLPGVKSAVVVALHYGPREDDPSWDVVSRYARGADYHNVMRPRLHVLRDYLIEAAGAGARASLDTSAGLERDLAAAAGLGWVGKNTNLIAPRAGSYFFIGTVLTTAELIADGPVADHCG